MDARAHPVWTAAFSPNGRLIASGGCYGFPLPMYYDILTISDTSNGKAVATPRWLESMVYGVAFSPDGRLLASAGVGREIKLWDVSTWKEAASLGPLQVSNGISQLFAFSPDGRTIAAIAGNGTGSGDKKVTLWSVPEGRCYRTFGLSTNIGHLLFTPDGKQIVVTVSDAVDFLDFGTGRVVVSLRNTTGTIWNINCIAIRPDGRILAVGRGRDIELWDLASRAKTVIGAAHEASVRSAAFSPDGKILASGDFGKTVKLWNLATRKDVFSVAAHGDCVTCVTFSSDGRTLATASIDKTIKLWDIRPGK
jgi:WD40 repeat protein